jgi:hypothetical protein
MHLRTVTWLLLLSLNVAFGEQKQDKIDWQPWSDSVFAQAKKEGALCLARSRRRVVSLVPCHGRGHVPGSEGDRVDSLTLRRCIGR